MKKLLTALFAILLLAGIAGSPALSAYGGSKEATKTAAQPGIITFLSALDSNQPGIIIFLNGLESRIDSAHYRTGMLKSHRLQENETAPETGENCTEYPEVLVMSSCPGWSIYDEIIDQVINQ